MQGSENEGGRVRGEPPAYTTKPPWSVRSLQELNEAIRQSQRPDSPWRLHEEAARAEREKVENAEAHDARIAAAERRYRNRFRNAWENT
jgi:hypothetical protein